MVGSPAFILETALYFLLGVILLPDGLSLWPQFAGQLRFSKGKLYLKLLAQGGDAHHQPGNRRRMMDRKRGVAPAP